MDERRSGLWRYRLLFVAIAAGVFFLQLLPLHPGPGQVPGPDVLLLIALAWTVVRPALAPVWLVAGVFLVADLLLMRPLGLWTLLVIMGCEFLRSRRALLKNVPFVVEWLSIAGVVTVMTVVQAVILTVFAVPQPTFGLTVIRLIFTVLAYPLVVVLAGRALGLTKPRGDSDRLGAHR